MNPMAKTSIPNLAKPDGAAKHDKADLSWPCQNWPFILATSARQPIDRSTRTAGAAHPRLARCAARARPRPRGSDAPRGGQEFGFGNTGAASASAAVRRSIAASGVASTCRQSIRARARSPREDDAIGIGFTLVGLVQTDHQRTGAFCVPRRVLIRRSASRNGCRRSRAWGRTAPRRRRTTARLATLWSSLGKSQPNSCHHGRHVGDALSL